MATNLCHMCTHYFNKMIPDNRNGTVGVVSCKEVHWKYKYIYEVWLYKHSLIMCDDVL